MNNKNLFINFIMFYFFIYAYTDGLTKLKINSIYIDLNYIIVFFS